MSDYGIKISEPGYDVKTASKERLIVSSQYPFLKGKNTIESTAYDEGYETASTTVEISHNLGYIPIVRVFRLFEGSYSELPFREWQSSSYSHEMWFELTTSKVIIKEDLWVNGDTATIDSTYRTYISREKINI